MTAALRITTPARRYDEEQAAASVVRVHREQGTQTQIRTFGARSRGGATPW